MNREIDISISDDYAAISTYNYGFYYGYEFDSNNDEDIWGFETCEDDKPFRISYDEMSKYKDCPSQWECTECLLFGIGLWLENKKGGNK